MSLTNRPFFAIIPFLLAFSLGLWRLENESIWHDEAWSIRAIDSPFGTPDDNTPPFYYMSLHLLQRLGVGHSTFSLRYGSVLIQLFTVALAFRLAGRWYKKREMAFLAGALMALSPLLWEYSQEVRAYVAVPVFALLFLLGVDWLMRVQTLTPQNRLFFFAAELLGLYTHNLLVPLVLWLNIVVLGWAILRRDIFFYAKWLTLQMAIFVAYIPWLLTQSPSGTKLNTVPKFGRELSQELWRGYIFPVVSDPAELPREFLTLVHLLPLLAGMALIILVWRGRNRPSLLILSQVILLPIFSTLLLQRASIDFHPRYYILALPSTLLLLVAAVASLPARVQWGGLALVLGASASISHYSLNYIAAHPQYQHDDFRGMADYYASLPANTLILIPFEDEPALQYYYLPQAQYLNFPLHSSATEALEKLKQALAQGQIERIEFLTWYQVPADIRGMYGCFLGAAGDLGQGLTHYGLHSQAYLNPKPFEMETLGGQADFGIAQMVHLAYTKTEAQTCIMQEWLIPSAAELKSALTLYNPFEQVMAKTDSLILDEAQQAARAGNAFSLLALPQGLPADDYLTGIVLYSDSHPSGYDLLQGGKTHWINLDLPYTPFQNPPTEATIKNSPGQAIFSGLPLELEMVSPSGEVSLRLEGEGWLLEDKINMQHPALLWHSFQIPPDASGTARLYFDEVHLADYMIIRTERLWEAPPSDLAIQAKLGDWVNLVGASVAQTPQSLTIDLVWRPEQSPKLDYWVFAQVLDMQGALLAQSDAEPRRPTSSWLPGEYLLDSHSIKLDDVNYRGEARLITGLYNPRNGERLRLADGRDFVTLPIEIIIGDN